MTWARFDDQFWSHPKVLRAGNEAVGVFVRMVCYCNAHLTDGVVPGDTFRLIAGRRHPAVRTALLTAGLATSVTGLHAGYTPASECGDDPDALSIHDFLDWNPSAEQVREQRSKNTAKVTNWRENKRKAKAVTGLHAGSEPGCNRVVTPPLSRPLPEESATHSLVAAGSAGPATTEAPPPQPCLTLTPPPGNDTPRAATKTGRKRPDTPLPFSVQTAIGALHETARGKFLAGEPRDLTQGVAIGITRTIRRYPDLDEWRGLGRFLAAGGRPSRGGAYGPSWVASAGFGSAMAEAREWLVAGGPQIDQRTGGWTPTRLTAEDEGYRPPTNGRPILTGQAREDAKRAVEEHHRARAERLAHAADLPAGGGTRG